MRVALNCLLWLLRKVYEATSASQPHLRTSHKTVKPRLKPGLWATKTTGSSLAVPGSSPTDRFRRADARRRRETEKSEKIKETFMSKRAVVVAQVVEWQRCVPTTRFRFRWVLDFISISISPSSILPGIRVFLLLPISATSLNRSLVEVQCFHTKKQAYTCRLRLHLCTELAKNHKQRKLRVTQMDWEHTLETFHLAQHSDIILNDTRFASIRKEKS